ncbi:MAG: endolytic transglycosylase MltG [Thermodesulfobacteriota bacterium]
MKKFAIFSTVFLCIAAVASGAIVFDLVRYAKTPVSFTKGPLSIEIPRGQSFHKVTERLTERNVITHPLKFKLVARYTGHDQTLKSGEYRLSPNMTPIEILEHFSQGDVVLHQVTLPEGFSLQNVAARLEARGLVGQNDFLAVATDPEFSARMGIAADTVEGYLFPDTYFFEKKPAAKTVITTMIQRFFNTFKDPWRRRAEKLGFTVHEVVTLASIIEKETGVEKERPVIASVFHNRLEKGMRLASDPTVIYGVRDFDGNLTRKHLKESTPYNTYVNRGLPPGPIANPGRASLKAALYPADTDYLFFVAKPDRTHHFSTNYEAHKKAVRKYQLQ